MKPRDNLLAVLVGHVATFLDERVFGRLAQIVIPCDDLLAVLVDRRALWRNTCHWCGLAGIAWSIPPRAFHLAH